MVNPIPDTFCSILCKFSQFVPVDPRAALEAQSEGDAREANGETSRRCVLKIADSNEAQISKHADCQELPGEGDNPMDQPLILLG
jgi:hypothetical protein